MSSEEDRISQPSEIGKSLVLTAQKNSLRGKSLSVNHSSTVVFAIPMSGITGIIATAIPHGILIHQTVLILTKVSWPSIQDNIAIRLLFKISTSHCFEQFPQHHHQQVTISTVPQSRKARGQVTIAWIVKVFTVHSNHSKSLLLSVETVFTPVKADFLRDFSSLQQHPMLPSAYLKEPTPQSSAGSIF